MKPVEFEHLLPLISKPSRYIDNEINAVHKDASLHAVKLCLAFPDVYEIGISHLGIKILYSIINRLDYAMADRTYLPWIDFIGLMREEGIPLFAVESRLPLKAFDLIGITLQSELTFTNVLELLDVSDIPLRGSERSENDPIIIAGGPCATNPLPLSPFIDAFLIGEGEEAIVEICRIMLQERSRAERLRIIAGLEGMYVPQIHDRGNAAIHIRKFNRFHEMSDIHTPQLLSWQLATHNRHVSEIMRGCSRGCRFCHAGYFYRPVRERSMADIIGHIISESQQSGWDEAGLLSLSSSDYSCIKPLLQYLLEQVDSDKTHIALPSLRVDSLDDELVTLIGKLGREGLTIAPEAGSQRLRDIINKNLTETDILQAVEIAMKLGWQKVKLYFMVGLPFETDEDIDAMISLIDRINQISRKRLNFNITISPFVPKTFTPFQWSPMLPRDQLLQRILRVKTYFQRNRNIRIRYHTIETSMLETVIGRGDERCAEWIYQAWQNGARYDGWQECFDFAFWQEAALITGLDIDRELQSRDPNARQCWEFIDLGITHDFLLSEYREAQNALTTPDCRDVCCRCGVCDPKTQTMWASETALADQTPLSYTSSEGFIDKLRSTRSFRYRLFYEKTGLLRFISHLDWMRMIYRLIAAADLAVAYTQGFSPHPKVSFCPPLANGVEGTNEYFDFELHAYVSTEKIIREFSRIRIKGFKPTECQNIPNKVPLARAEVITLPIPPELTLKISDRIALFDALPSLAYIKHRNKGDKTYDLKQVVHSIDLQEHRITLIKSLQSPPLFELLQVILDIPKELIYRLRLTRTAILDTYHSK